MNKGLIYAVGGSAVLLAVIYGWMWLGGGGSAASPEELARQALEAATAEEQEQAAVRLAALPQSEARSHLRDVLRQSKVAGVRAACLQGLGASHDYQSMDLLLEALEDESPLVRGRAGVAVTRMIGRDYHFRANGSEESRAKAVKGIRTCWEEMKKSKLLESFKQELQQ